MVHVPPFDDDAEVTRSSHALTAGTDVGNYRILSRIGAGGMGEVYLAEHRTLGRKAALKFLPLHLAADDELRSRFLREAQAAARLDHPNIITVYEVGDLEGRPHIAMQYVEGETLAWLSRNETLTIEQAAHLTTQVCNGLSAAHQAGIVHRDIKSANIIVDKDHRPRILDFGLAAVQGSEMLTRAGSTLGTVTYMSPEQAQGREVDHRSDLFSLGIVFYELLAGRTPFKRANDAATLHAIIHDTPEPIARYKADATPELQRIVTKALAKRPDERYQSAADFAADLMAIVRSLSSPDRTTGSIAIGKPSIAVLPFTNMSRDEENEFFADGLAEELLNVLAKNSELRVTGRTSSFAFKGKQEDLRTIGQKLGVGTLLEGSVRKAGNRVRITAQLVNVADGFHLWSETYDRVLDDIFAVQDDIAKAVSGALHVALVGTGDTQPVDAETYALIMRAHQSHMQMNKQGLAMALELYKKAIDRAPKDARAWAGLSSVYTSRVAYGHSQSPTEAGLAREAAERAIALDDNSAMAHHALAFVLGALELRYRESYVHMVRAYELAPNDADMVMHMALWEMLRCRLDRAFALAQKAIELDPLNPWARRELGRVLTMWGRNAEARAALQQALEFIPDMTTVYMGLSWLSLFEGKYEEALELAAKERAPGYRLCAQAMALHSLGRKEDSDRALAELMALGDSWCYQMACVHAWRGEVDEAFTWLDRGYETRDSGIPLTRVMPLFEPLHADPRWQPLLEKAGLAD